MMSSNRAGPEMPGFLAPVARFWTGTYAPDYVGFTFLLTMYLLIQFLVEPFHRMFSITNLDISFPHAEHERVSTTMNFVYALFIPLGLIALYNLLARSTPHTHHVSVLGLAVALVLTATLTDIVKNAVGRPRPDLIARCKPRAGTPTDQLVAFTVCTEPDHHTLHDGWRSFPSGHSSFAFAGLGYCCLFLAGQLKVFALRSNGTGGGAAGGERSGAVERVVHQRGDLGRAIVCLAPLVGAAMIAISRCQDYRHDVYDVCTGALMGWVVAYWSYRRYWPRLGSRHCDEPYPGPEPVDLGSRYGQLRDEEEGAAGQNVD